MLKRYRNLPAAHPLLLGLTTLVFAAACQKSGVKVNGRSVGAAVSNRLATSIATPIEIPGGLGAARQYYQSRNVITLRIADPSLSSGDSLQIFNDATGDRLVNAPAVTFGLDTAGGDAFALDAAPYELTLRIYPLAPEYAGKFVYAKNPLRLLIGAADATRTAEQDVYLHDFRFGGLATAGFVESNHQRIGGLQGRLGLVANPIGSNGHGSTLSTGAIGLLNR